MKKTLLTLAIAGLCGSGCVGNTDAGHERMSRSHFEAYSRALTLYRNQRLPEADKELDKLLEKGNSHLEPRLLKARLQFHRKNFSDAEATLRRLQSDFPENTHIQIWLGKTLLVSQKAPEAEKLFRELLRKNPESYHLHYYLGRSLEEQGQLQPALIAYQHALAQERNLSGVHLHMAQMFHKLKMTDRARRHAGRVQLLNASQADVEAATKILATPEEPIKKTASRGK